MTAFVTDTFMSSDVHDAPCLFIHLYMVAYCIRVCLLVLIAYIRGCLLSLCLNSHLSQACTVQLSNNLGLKMCDTTSVSAIT